MEYTYHITYSCYSRQMQILLNDKNVLSSSSSIIQYMNEPFYTWCDRILPLLYRELGESYHLIFTGRGEEADILRKVAAGLPFCLSVETRSLGVSLSLQERMKALSQVINDKHLLLPPPVQIRAVFIGVQESLEKWAPFIEQLEIKNRYCEVHFRTTLWKGTDRIQTDEIPFYLAGNEDDVNDFCNYERGNEKYTFILEETGPRTPPEGFIELRKGNYIYSISDSSFFTVVFECFLLFPLAEAFSKYTQSLLKTVHDVKINQYLRFLLSVKPTVHIEVEESVELDHSIPFKIAMEPPDAVVPALTFEYQFPEIVECTNLRVYGKKTGKTKVKVFEKGEVAPIETFTFTVFKRNRVDHILLSEHSLTAGVGDVINLSCDYSPPDADNINQMRWYSDHPEVASVNQKGRVLVRAPGKCRIYCSVEQIASSCSILAKSYLKSIFLPECVDGGVLFIGVGEQKNISCAKEPEDAFDGNLKYSSSDLMILNIDGSMATGISDGEADVIVCSSSNRLTTSFHVVVGRGNKPPEKRRKKLFGLFG